MRRYFTYNKKSGELRWRKTRRLAAKHQVTVNGIRFMTPRVIWHVVTGDWPPVGHHVMPKNGNWQDLRWDNLVLVAETVARVTRKRRADNRSGVTGVFFDGRRGKWRVECCGRTVGYTASRRAALTMRRAAVEALK